MGPITDQERTKPSSSARTIAPAATPMKRFRERAYALAFWAITSSVFAVVAFASSVASWLRSAASCSALLRSCCPCRALAGRDSMISLHDRREPIARHADPAKDSARPRRGARIRGLSAKVAGPIRASCVDDRPVDTRRDPSPVALGSPWSRTRRSRSATFSARSRRTLHVSLWSLPYATARSWSGPSLPTRSFDCAEDAQPEHADGDDQHGGAHERDEQLGVDLGRQAADSADERIVAGAQRPARRDDGGRPRCFAA